MRSDANLVAIMESIQAATPPPATLEVMPLSIFSGIASFTTPRDPVMRRAVRLAVSDRLATFQRMTDDLAVATDVPTWLAHMALDAAIPDGRENDLDEPSALAPALLRAMVAMGFRPCRPT